jgi:hypothetical protein
MIDFDFNKLEEKEKDYVKNKINEFNKTNEEYGYIPLRISVVFGSICLWLVRVEGRVLAKVVKSEPNEDCFNEMIKEINKIKGE